MAARMVVDGGSLWQWDIGRAVWCIEGTEEAHFAVDGSDEAYCTLPDEKMLAEIPNLLLQVGRDVLCWATDGERTLGMSRLVVHRRAKPPDYVYTSTEIESVESIVAEAVSAALAELSYEDLSDLPTIEEVEVVGDLHLSDFGLGSIGTDDIESLFG